MLEMAEKQAALPRFSPLMIWGSINIPARQKAPGNPRRDGRFYSLAEILQRTSLIFPGEYPHPCQEIPGGKKFLPPPPRESFEKWTPPPGLPVLRVVEGCIYLYLYPMRMGTHRLLVLVSVSILKIRPPPSKKKQGKKRKQYSTQGNEERRKKKRIPQRRNAGKQKEPPASQRTHNARNRSSSFTPHANA